VFNHLFIRIQATGIAKIIENIIKVAESTANSFIIPVLLAPTTFLIPISFVLCITENAVSPNKPIHAIKIVIIEKKVSNVDKLSSAL